MTALLAFLASNVWRTAALALALLAVALAWRASAYGGALAECERDAAEQTAALATARAEAERLRAEQIGTLNLLIAQDDADTRAELERAQALTRSAAAAYAAAQRAHPTTCRASADHVRAVNAARGAE